MKNRILYKNPNKFEKEQSFFNTFLDNLKDESIRKWEKDEAPDYVLHIGPNRIGLEVTALVLESSLAAIRSAQNECLKKASQLANENGLKPMEVKVKFRSDDLPIDVEVAALELFKFVKNKIDEIDDLKTWHYYESNLKFSKWVSIHKSTVNGKKWLDHHRFDRIHMNWMSIDPIKKIQKSIDQKQSKIQNYRKKCDECWLLIGVDEWTRPEAVAITDQIKNHQFLGDFKRLFFVRNIEGHLMELKIRSTIIAQ